MDKRFHTAAANGGTRHRCVRGVTIWKKRYQCGTCKSATRTRPGPCGGQSIGCAFFWPPMAHTVVFKRVLFYGHRRSVILFPRPYCTQLRRGAPIRRSQSPILKGACTRVQTKIIILKSISFCVFDVFLYFFAQFGIVTYFCASTMDGPCFSRPSDPPDNETCRTSCRAPFITFRARAVRSREAGAYISKVQRTAFEVGMYGGKRVGGALK